ncbi:MAG: hypothetical protein LBU35_00660 [Holosporales bacterium]|jgi:hypothetical protein|nr:hypothetical protein [Holosporales bacterium]
MVFFETQEDAAAALKTIKSGEEKFSSIFKERQSKGAVDLGYVKSRGTTPEIWSLLKKGASGTCCDQVIALDGSNFGLEGLNYAIMYIADRRPLTLPTLSDPAVKKNFQRLAEREKAGKLAETHLITGIKTIEGRPIDDFKKNPEYMERMLSFLIGFAGL